jgi:DNA segregation ATPase FtsK/SpoIIIE, S-DNA-T family
LQGGPPRPRELSSDSLALDADQELQDSVEAMLRDGPEVGVHIWTWSETAAGIARKLSSAAIREFGWRIASKMSADDSHGLLGSDVAAGLRQDQIVATNVDLGFERRATTYGLPDLDWLLRLLAEVGDTR